MSVGLRIILRSGEPRPGMEAAYRLAWKHRARMSVLWLQTPWWQWRRKRRRWDAYLHAIGRTHSAGQDVVLRY